MPAKKESEESIKNLMISIDLLNDSDVNDISE